MGEPASGADRIPWTRDTIAANSEGGSKVVVDVGEREASELNPAESTPSVSNGPESVGPELVAPELVGPELVAPELVAPELVAPDAARADPQPGWYLDPDGLDALRWWDGGQWTDDRFDGGEAAGGAGRHRAPMTRRGRSLLPDGTRVYTQWIWILVFLPILSTMTLLLIDPTSPHLRQDPILIATALVAVVVWMACAILARLDQTDLAARGVERPFSWAWSLLGAVIYAIGRSVIVYTVSGRGRVPLLVSIVVTIVAAVAAAAWVITALEANLVDMTTVPTMQA